jgi:threonine dehydrogenase-like Zn-dependent dehydrogenase
LVPQKAFDIQESTYRATAIVLVMADVAHVAVVDACRTGLHETLLVLGAGPLGLPASVLAGHEVAVAVVAVLDAGGGAFVAFVEGEG